MKKNTVYLVIGSILIFSLSLGMMFLLNDTMKIEGDNQRILYYIVKGISLTSLIVFTIYIAVKKSEPVSSFYTIIFTLVIQIYPFLLRIWLNKSDSFVLPVFVSFIIYIIYFVLIMVLDYSKDLVLESSNDLEGKEIKVTDESQYYDENGNFVGKRNL